MILPSPSQHVLFPQGGAVAGGPADYPIPWRQAAGVVHPFGLWGTTTRPEAMVSGAVYLNVIGDEGEERIVAGVGQDNYGRLAAVKAQYDPLDACRVSIWSTPKNPGKHANRIR